MNSEVDTLDSCGSTNATVNTVEGLQLDKPILYVHQNEWQKELDLLLWYVNLLILMDATYKTTKYSIYCSSFVSQQMCHTQLLGNLLSNQKTVRIFLKCCQ